MLGWISRAAASASRWKRETNAGSVGEMLGEQLDGDVALEALVEREVHGRHAAGAEPALEPVAAGDQDLGSLTRHFPELRPRRRPRRSVAAAAVALSVPLAAARWPCPPLPWAPSRRRGGAVVVAAVGRRRGCGRRDGRGRARRGGASCGVPVVVVVVVEVLVELVVGRWWSSRPVGSVQRLARAGPTGWRARLQRRCLQAGVRPIAGSAAKSLFGRSRALRCGGGAVRRLAASVGLGDGFEVALQRPALSAGIRPPVPSCRRRTAATSGEAERQAACKTGSDGAVTGRTPGARRASPAAGRRGSRRRRRRRRTRCGGSRRSSRSVSSSSHAARGSPSRGWPTLPGFSSHSPSERSSRSPSRGGSRRWPARPRGARTRAPRGSGRPG